MTPSICDLAAFEGPDLAVAELLGGVFGWRDDQVELVGQWRAEPLRHVVVAQRDGQVVGLAAGHLGCIEQHQYYLPFDDQFSAFVDGALLAELQILAVAPGCRRSGLGGRLSAALLKSLQGAGATVAVGVSWDNGSPDSSRHLFEGAGFERRGRIANYYRKRQEETGQTCPYCAPGPCGCGAILYIKAL